MHNSFHEISSAFWWLPIIFYHENNPLKSAFILSEVYMALVAMGIIQGNLLIE